MTDEKKPPQEVADVTICAGVDVMADRLEVALCAFGSGAQPLAFNRHIAHIYGDPAQGHVWGLLWSLLQVPVHHPGAGLLGIRAAGVDSGGHHTRQVYRFVHQHGQPGPHAPRLFALKACSTRGSAGGIKSMKVDVAGHDKAPDACIALLLVDVENDHAGPDADKYAQAVYEWLCQPRE